MRRIRWGLLLALAAVAALAFSIIKSVAAGPANVARPSDTANAAKDVPPPAGAGDDRAPLAPHGYVSGNGIIEPADRETKVAGQAAGRIAVVDVKEGDVVEAGTALVELEGTPEKTALDAAEADVEVQTAMLLRTAQGMRKEDVEALIDEAGAAKARAEMSSEVLARTERLASSGAVAGEELDRARRQAEADQRSYKAADARRLSGVNGGRREDVVVAQAQVRAALARRDEARAALERLTVRAPIAGTLLQVKCRAGEYYNPAAANAASSESLVVMGDMRAVRTRIDVDERDVARIQPGAHGYVTLSAFPGRRFSGRVVEIGARMGRKNVRTDDPVERLDVKILEVVMEMDVPDDLIPGIRVTAYIEAGRGEGRR
jgi:HlyD family secretion protein